MEVCPVFISVFLLMVSTVIVYMLYMSRHSKLFKKLGIPGPTPWFWLGNLPDIMREGFRGFHERLYKEFADEKVYGVHEPGKAFIVVKDLDMIRDICIKNFNCFVNRRIFFDRYPFDHMMIILKNDHWRHVRNAVSPAFSSGKLKRMFVHVEKSTGILLSNLRQSCDESKAVELKTLMACFTMDVIASTGFGVDIDSLNDKNSQFVIAAKRIISGFSGAGVGLAMLCPPLAGILEKIGIEVLPTKSALFFFKFVDEAIANREQGKILSSQNDFLQLMINAEESPEENANLVHGRKEKIGITHEDIQGQSLIFILAGYDTVSTTLSFTLFLLAHHHECCVKIQEEVDRVLDGKFPTYETVQELTYVDMCINEALRMYAPGFVFDRECNEDCTIGGVHIPKGVHIIVPVVGIHHDPKLWPEPEKFDPERFTSENKNKRHPCAHLPFGQGPRICIGMRLALIEVKVAIASILQEMTPVPCEKSVYPIVLDRNEFKAVDGLWVKFVPRKAKEI